MLAPEDEPFDGEGSRILEEEDEDDDNREHQEQKEKKDRYVGGIDPVTGLRVGKGTYKYSNPYFTYEGEWVDGKKHGQGKLLFADGGFFEGTFDEGQINGYGIRVWPNGWEYKGDWKKGEKHGHGTLENHETGESYVGDWNMNLRHGGGKWTKSNKEVVDGEFKHHFPQGHVSMRLSNGDLYDGNVEKGVIHGQGKYWYLSTSMCYEGEFVDAKRQGLGKFYAMKGAYVYEGRFEDDKPTKIPNQLLYYQEPKEEEPEDKKKKDNKKGEPEEDENPNKIVYEVGVSEPIRIELRAVFQGEDYEDDTPPDEEELKKQAASKKGKANDEPEVKMVTPDPVIIEDESGRAVSFSLGRFEDKPLEEGQEQEGEPEKIWVEYKFSQNEDLTRVEVLSKEGIFVIEGLTYNISEEFKAGKYEILAKDVTPFIDNHLNEVKISLEIIDPEEPPVPAKGKKK